MNEYVVLCPRLFVWSFSGYKNTAQVLLVQKNKPAWQRGRLNLVGGKIEAGETPEQAALRELEEEAGFSAKHKSIEEVSNAVLCGKIIGADCVVHCLSCDLLCNDVPNILPREGETELVGWHNWNTVKTDPRLIPNLKVIIPLLVQDSQGWEITDQDSSSGSFHKIGIQLEISQPFVNSGK